MDLVEIKFEWDGDTESHLFWARFVVVFFFPTSMTVNKACACASVHIGHATQRKACIALPAFLFTWNSNTPLRRACSL